MILAPVPETDLDEGDARVVLVHRIEVGVELLGEPLQLGVRPVGIPGGTVFILVESLLVSRQRLDVGWYGRSAGVSVHAAFARILIAETDHRLMAARGHILEPAVEAAPVIADHAIVFSRDDLAGKAIRIFQRDGLAEGGMAVAGVFAPEHEAGGRLHGIDLALNGNGSERIVQFGREIFVGRHAGRGGQCQQQEGEVSHDSLSNVRISS